MKYFLSLLLFIIFNSSLAEVKDPMYDELEGLDLIEALVRDNKLTLAEEEFQKKHPKSARSYYLKGRLRYAQEKWVDATGEFTSAANFESDPELKNSISIFHAMSLSHRQMWKECRDQFSKVERRRMNLESQVLARASCEKNSGDFSQAWKTLAWAQRQWNSFSVKNEEIQLLLDLKLVHQAQSAAFEWFRVHAGLASQYQNIAEVFFQRGESESALELLELGRLAHPLNVDLNLALAQFYFQKNNYGASAEGFVYASLSDNKYSFHAAETYRQMHLFQRSQFWNQFIVDPKEKLRQTMALYIDQAQYPKISTLENIIMRSELHKDDELRYALAYSMALNGEVDVPLKYLASIQKPELLEKSSLLRKALLDCKVNGDLCRL
ncbi:MAG: tetratricopeptide repeat protein [Bdellovibrionales bacterium]|nr:tetratricopeptide repeat protein [Bdellovibrionales bacterium]